MTATFRLVICLTIVLFDATSARAQDAVAAPASASSRATVSVVTYGPGAMAFEKFGHTALHVRDPARGIDVACHWGVFDDSPGLIARFVHGRLRYEMTAEDPGLMLEHYRREGRSAWAQELELSDAEVARLVALLDVNLDPRNRAYRYDYYRDNCTTRARDAIDAVAGGPIGRGLRGVSAGATYRDHTRRTTAGDVPLYTALQAVLGHPVDRPLDAWEECFLPFEFQRHLRSVITVDANGNPAPLVRREVTLFDGTRPMPGPGVPTLWPWFAVAGATVGALMAALSGPARRKRWARAALLIPATAWSLLAGVGGLIIVYSWLFTDHFVATRNENLLQLCPPLVAMPVLVMLAFFGRTGPARWAVRIAGFATLCSAVGLMLKLLPPFHQANADIIALALPLNVGLLVATWRSFAGIVNRPSRSSSRRLSTSTRETGRTSET